MGERIGHVEPTITVGRTGDRTYGIRLNNPSRDILEDIAWQRYLDSRWTRNSLLKRIFPKRRRGFEKMDHWDPKEAMVETIVEALKAEQLLADYKLYINYRVTYSDPFFYADTADLLTGV